MSLLSNTTRKATALDAREMIIFGFPKIGKTQMLTQLPGKYLILDFDDGGSDFYDSESIVVKDYEHFGEIRKAFVDENPQYDFIVLDTITAMYDSIINSIAVTLYNADNKKQKPLSWDIDKLDYGKGYVYKRDAMKKVVAFFKKYCKCLILVGHVKDAVLDTSSGQISTKSIDLDGKLKNIMALKTDALGMLYRSREKDNQNILSFKTSASDVSGTRIQHLANREIVISEKNEDGTLKVNWEEVFPNIIKSL